MNLKKTLKRALAYPTLGNLSSKLQTQLEKKWDWYDGFEATEASSFVNIIAPIIYGAVSSGASSATNNDLVMMGVSGYFALEAAVRINTCKIYYKNWNEELEPTYTLEDTGNRRPVGSLIGKIISLPFESIIR
jgi:hypothetical protein